MWVSEEEWSRPVQQTPEVACVGCGCSGAHHDAAFNPAAGKSVQRRETEKTRPLLKIVKVFICTTRDDYSY